MNVYIFDNVSNLTGRFHSDGGLVIIAMNREHAQEIIAADLEPGFGPSKEEWDEVIVIPASDDAQPRSFVFPDAGCC